MQQGAVGGALTGVAALHLGGGGTLGGGHVAYQHVHQARGAAKNLAAGRKGAAHAAGWVDVGQREGGGEAQGWAVAPALGGRQHRPASHAPNLPNTAKGWTEGHPPTHLQASLSSGLTSMPYEEGFRYTPNSSATARTLRSSSPTICRSGVGWRGGGGVGNAAEQHSRHVTAS